MNYTYEEYQEAKRGGHDPKRLKNNIKAAWAQADNRQSFEAALERSGLFLAKGDRRAFVCVDYEGNTYSLSRWVGQKTKEIEARLGAPEELRDVQATQAFVAERMTPQILSYIDEATETARLNLSDIEAQRQDMAAHHKRQRDALKSRMYQRWEVETQERLNRFSGGLKGLWHRISGKHQKTVAENEEHAKKCLKRDVLESTELRNSQNAARTQLQKHLEAARSNHQDQLETLYAQIRTYRAMGNSADQAAEIHDRLNRHRANFSHAAGIEFDL